MRVYRWFALLIAFAAVSGLSAADIGVTMSMPNDLNANPGGIVTVPINLSGVQASFSLDAFQLIVEYDNAFFETPLATGFKLGTLTSGRDYTGLDGVTAASKSFSILRSATSNPASLTTSSTGSLMTFEIQVRASVAPGSSGYLRFLATQGAANTEMLTLSGDTVVFEPAITAPAVQGLVTVPVPEPSTYVLAMVSTVVLAAIARSRSSARKSAEPNRFH